LNIVVIYVEGGVFKMGCDAGQSADCNDDEKPSHQVEIRSFKIGKYEVTQAQWKAVMNNNPSKFQGDNLPVTNVSWNDVQEFILKLNNKTGKKYRLPTEAEWEYAAKGGQSSNVVYKYSGSNSINAVAWYSSNSDNITHPVGSKSSNVLGIYDMNGNVHEWCSDWYAMYKSNYQNNPAGSNDGTYKICRGGGAKSQALNCRNTFRSLKYKPNYQNDFIGFRLVEN
ncbi:MAG: formylglycine-generating enzyme family protein, partial [Bacteroidales bacterium]|nr:formylglycine-generating enzyme family protein [Bacteroidales bacterium]